MKRLAKHAPHGIGTYVDSLYVNSLLHDEPQMLAFIDSVPAQGVDALQNDPLYQLALGFYFMHIDKVAREKQKFQSRNMELYASYLQAYAEKHQGEMFSFDANRTLRYSVGKVKSALPGEGIVYTPFTTVDGLMARKRMFTGNNDFRLPARLGSLIDKQDFGTYWKAGETPVCCFLTDANTAAGSSGSPVLNGKGELVGINFDRIWQGVSSTYEWNPEKSRNIVVDIRYILWVIEKYSASAYLLNELKVNR
ncbi:S46 family peptidase [Bacteroides reticulotermitis]|uniref:S46 family peptidase n=1 Tax=Bacteroides reticulotermitis TaxID=1133319 RepID=UPI003F6E53BE